MKWRRHLMTIKRDIEVDCPNCGTGNLILVWDTINAQVSPEAKTGLLRGEINVFRCRLCEEMITIDKPLLYNDMESKFMVWYFPFAWVENGRILDAITPDGRTKGTEYFPEIDLSGRIHHVFDMNELVRYIRFRDVLVEEVRHAAG
jgi:hypothetical protein